MAENESKPESKPMDSDPKKPKKPEFPPPRRITEGVDPDKIQKKGK